MATKVIGDYSAAVSIDGSTHYLLIQPGSSSTAYNKINRSTLLGVTGQPMDISTSQTVSNKTLGNSNIAMLRDDRFTLQDSGDTTKQAVFELSGITTGTTRTYTLPDASTTVVGTTTTQTLTNKTLTAPTITNGSITGSTITTDAIVGQSVSTSGTVYGLSIASSKVGTNGVVTASITNASVTASKLATGATAAFVSTAEQTSSTTYTDLATVTDTVTVTIGANGIALVIINSLMQNTTLGSQAWVSFAVSGASTQAASDNFAIETQSYTANAQSTQSGVFLVTGLSAGSTTFKMKYRASANTAQFQFRRIAVVPL